LGICRRAGGHTVGFTDQSGSDLFELLFKYSRETFDRGEFLFASGWPLWLLVLLVAVGAAVVATSLVRYRQDLNLFKVGVLGFLQVLLLAIVLTMLWQPGLMTQTLRPQENNVAILIDTSASMGYGENGQSRLQQAVQTLNDGPLSELEETFGVQLHGFADRVTTIDSLSAVPAPGPTTRIGDALLSVLRGSSAGALAAVVLVTDGADNSDGLDAAAIAEIASFGIPVHTLGVGREVLPEDLELEDVVLAAQSAPGSTVNAQVSIRHSGSATAQLKVYDGEAIVASDQILLPDTAGVTTRSIDIDVGSSGVRDLRFTVDAISSESNLINNTQLRPMEVPERRRHVLYIEGEPRWEYKFMRRAIDETGPIRLASLLRTTPNKFYRQGVESAEELADGFPIEERDLFAYDAVIIGSFEAAALSESQHAMLLEFVSRRGGSLLMLGGRRGLADGGWGATVLAEALPANLPVVDAVSFNRFPAKAILTEIGARSLLTRFESDAEANAASWRELPELADFQFLQGLKPAAEVLLEAEVQGQNWPLLVHHRYGLGNSYILATGGTWRWQMQLPYEDMRHEVFWQQLIRTLASGAPERVMLSTESVFYGDRRTVTLRADVRDEDFNPTSAAIVSLAIDAPSVARRSVTMVPVPGMPGRYEASVDAADIGIYRFEAAADIDGEALGSSRVAVRRQDGVAEHFRVQQNRPLLERVAAATGGRYFGLNDADEIPQAVQFSDAGIVERQILDLWNMPIFFVLLILLKAGEWVSRLLWGRL
jgi:uncharacterized membrane protein